MRATRSAEEFSEFVRATSSQLTRSAVLLTGDWHLAEDLTQVTYAKVFASWRNVKDEPLGYARKTLLRCYLSHRRLRRNSEEPREWLTEESVREGPDHSTRMDVLAAVATLPPVDRAIVVLRYWEDRSVAETAFDLDLSEANVRTRARRALQKLRPLLVAPEVSPLGPPSAAYDQETSCS